MIDLLKKHFFIIGVLTLAFVIRFYKLGTVPIELNRDEASLGYTAYSILLTGKEEHGVPWPVQIESFGDWKLPLYVYTLVPFIAAFGLEAWVVRLPSALAGMVIIWLSYLLVLKLVRDKKYQGLVQKAFVVLLTVSPWAMHLSHVAYEAHLALAFFLGGLWLLLEFLESKKTWQLILGHVFWALTLLGYHSYQAFVPLFWFSFVWTQREVFFRWLGVKDLQEALTTPKSLLRGAYAVTPFLIVGFLLLFSGGAAANTTKFSGLSIFDLNSYTKSVDKLRAVFAESPSSPSLTSPLVLVYSNKIVALFRQVQTNFFALLSPDFFYLRGGENGAHNITGIGNFYPFMVIGLFAGLYWFVKDKELWQRRLLVWVGIAMVAPMITFTSNHTIRFSPGFIPLELISTYGLVRLGTNLWKKQKLWDKLIVLSCLLWVGYAVFSQMMRYYFVSPQLDAKNWSWFMKGLVYQIDRERSTVDAVYYQDEQTSPYIYFLFYLKVDPNTLADRVEYYPPDAEGFRHVRRFDNIYFEKIDWDGKKFLDQNALYLIEERKVPDFNRTQEGMKLLEWYQHPYVDKGVELWRYQQT